MVRLFKDWCVSMGFCLHNHPWRIDKEARDYIAFVKEARERQIHQQAVIDRVAELEKKGK